MKADPVPPVGDVPTGLPRPSAVTVQYAPRCQPGGRRKFVPSVSVEVGFDMFDEFESDTVYWVACQRAPTSTPPESGTSPSPRRPG